MATEVIASVMVHTRCEGRDLGLLLTIADNLRSTNVVATFDTRTLAANARLSIDELYAGLGRIAGLGELDYAIRGRVLNVEVTLPPAQPVKPEESAEVLTLTPPANPA